MRAAVILNPKSGSSLPRDALERLAGVEVHEIGDGRHAQELAREVVAAGVETVIAAGGDGTVSGVVDGLLQSRGSARLALLPLGTGNDLARSLGIPLEVDKALDVISSGPERVIDVIAADPEDGPRTYVVNVAAGGFSGQVDEELNSESKERWGPLAYVWTALSVLPSLRPYRTELTFDDGDVETIDALNVIVANGRSVAGGWTVAPLANIEDGLADVVIVRHGSALDLAAVAARLAAGNYLDSPHVEHRRAKRIRLRADPGMPFNVDGELLTRASCTFSVLPRALRVVVGPTYSAAPPDASEK